MPENKIGSDILGQDGSLGKGSGMSEKKRQEILKKIKDGKAKKGKVLHLDELNGKESPGEAIPGEVPHEKRLGESEIGEIGEDGKPVKVKSHRRGAPRKKQVEKLPKSFWE